MIVGASWECCESIVGVAVWSGDCERVKVFLEGCKRILETLW